jgi:hypothetical protein
MYMPAVPATLNVSRHSSTHLITGDMSYEQIHTYVHLCMCQEVIQEVS